MDRLQVSRAVYSFTPYCTSAIANSNVLGRVFALDVAIRKLVASIGIWFSGYAMDTIGHSRQRIGFLVWPRHADTDATLDVGSKVQSL